MLETEKRVETERFREVREFQVVREDSGVGATFFCQDAYIGAYFHIDPFVPVPASYQNTVFI
jgi:hypothetical protein